MFNEIVKAQSSYVCRLRDNSAYEVLESHALTDDQRSQGVISIATNLQDVPTDVVSLLYAERWSIEIFFRPFKHLPGCRHLLSHSRNGVEIQIYCAIIAWLLIALWTGRKPTKRTYEMICFYFCGLASQEELPAHLGKLPRQDEAPNKAS